MKVERGMGLAFESTLKPNDAPRDKGQIGFSGHLEAARVSAELMELKDQIAAQGERLVKKLDITELNYYKTLVSAFLRAAVGGAFSFEQSAHPDTEGGILMFASVKKVNENLSRLTEEILAEEKDVLEIMRLVDDIKGLIIDMLL